MTFGLVIVLSSVTVIVLSSVTLVLSELSEVCVSLQMGNEKNVTRPGGDADSDFEGDNGDESSSPEEDAGETEDKPPAKKVNRRALRKQALRVDSKRVVTKRERDAATAALKELKEASSARSSKLGSADHDGTARTVAFRDDTERIDDDLDTGDILATTVSHAAEDTGALAHVAAKEIDADAGSQVTEMLDVIDEGNLDDEDVEEAAAAHRVASGSPAKLGSIEDPHSFATSSPASDSLLMRTRMESTTSSIVSVGRLFDPLSVNSPSGLAKEVTRRRKVGKPKVAPPPK
jgi:hypothetical protein